jgi:hypothetical protein
MTCRYTKAQIRIYCNVKFDDKDEFKKYGGRWDSKCKSWYFFYYADDFKDREELHTRQYKPVRIWYIDQYLEYEDILQEEEEILKMANERHLFFIKPNKSFDEIFYLTFFEEYQCFCKNRNRFDIKEMIKSARERRRDNYIGDKELNEIEKWYKLEKKQKTNETKNKRVEPTMKTKLNDDPFIDD